jgi:hypothetical protein
MVGLFNWLWTAFLDACGIARENTVDYGLVSDPELVGSVDHSNEDINWRGAPGEYYLLARFTISMLPEPLD